MKTNLYFIPALVVLLITFKSFGQANTSLSNLTSPTAINTNLLPGTTNHINLGSGSKAWKNLYLTSGIYMNGALTFSMPLNTNIALGTKALYSTTTGSHCIGIGDSALYGITSGSGNTVIGNQAMYEASSASSNIAVGDNALYANKSAYYSVAIGRSALYHSNADYNHAIGYEALYENTTGIHNIAMGYQALINNTTANYSIGIGHQALFSNKTVSGLVALGDGALYSDTSGNENTAIGTATLYHNTSGYHNTAIGNYALFFDTTGYGNTAIGDGALYENTSGFGNTSTGYNALTNNRSGYLNTATGYNALSNNTTGVSNTATGYSALLSNNSGYANTSTGYYALNNNTYGNTNTAMGYFALSSSNTGTNNTAIGGYALYYNSGDDNTAIGVYAGVQSGTFTNTTAVGYDALNTANNQVRIGDYNVTSIGGYASWSNISDGRVKKNIKQNVPGLAFINKLQPVTYNLDLDAADKIIQYQRKDSTGKNIPLTQPEQAARAAKQKLVYTGFIAQDVEKAAKGLNYDFSGVDAAKNEKDLYGLRYAEFVVPLVKAVQELSKQNDSLQATNNALEARLARLESTVYGQSSGSKMTAAASSAYLSLSNASLSQNVPNPFAGATTISYTLPPAYKSASITVSNKNGTTLKQISVNATGKGSVQLDAASMPSGAYQYSLYIDGKLIDTKQMLLAK